MLKNRFFLSFCLLLSVAGLRAEDPLAAAQARSLEQAHAIVAASRAEAIEETTTAPDGEPMRRLVRRPRPDPLVHGTWVPPMIKPIATAGVPIGLDEGEGWISDIAIDNNGAVLLAGRRQVVVHLPESSQAETLSLAPSADLQWDARGERLLIASVSKSAIHAWPSRTLIHDLDQRPLNGSLVWAPSGDSLWKFADHFDPDASQIVRVLIRVAEVPLDAALPSREILTEPRRLATIGTLPPLGMAWGHPATLRQILPDPAPLWPLDPSFNLGQAPLTQPGQSVDLDPEADARGRIWFVRAARTIDTGDGVALPPSARGWMRDADGTARLVTGEPTYDLAVSPDGSRVAVLVRRACRGIVVATRADDLLARDLGEHASSLSEFESAATAALDDLRRAFAPLALAKPFAAVPVNYDQPITMTAADVAGLDAALRATLAQRVGLSLADDGRALGQLDGFLRAADGLWPEEPATILALAATYGCVLDAHDEVHWQLDDVMPSLSNDMQEATASDDVLYSLHTPYLVAREALAGRLSLDATATTLLTDFKRPIALVENFGAPAISGAIARPLVDNNMDPDDDLADLAARVFSTENPSDAALTLLHSRAVSEGDITLELAASMALARNNPTSPAALLRAAGVLHLLQFKEPAGLLLDRVAELAPDDLEVWVQLGEAWLDAGDLEAAERCYRRARELDRTNAYSLQITSAFQSIEARRPSP